MAADESHTNELKRSLSLVDVVGLGINGVVGTGIFLLPGLAAGITLVVFIAVGLLYIDTSNFTPFAPKGMGGNFFEATLIILYAYVGFEALVVPAGEMANPGRAVPLALFYVLGIVVMVYVGVLVVATGTLPSLAGHKNPVVAASMLFLGGTGAKLILAGIIISMVGEGEKRRSSKR